MDCNRWRKQIRDDWWPRQAWVDEWFLLVPAHLGYPGQNPDNHKMVVCVCVCVCVCVPAINNRPIGITDADTFEFQYQWYFFCWYRHQILAIFIISIVKKLDLLLLNQITNKNKWNQTANHLGSNLITDHQMESWKLLKQWFKLNHDPQFPFSTCIHLERPLNDGEMRLTGVEEAAVGNHLSKSQSHYGCLCVGD